ncbi:MAG: SGNH/GDSL hydrolase family protein [Clostridia bacterium]|nr:SGNH/GDSL hydrolase family protein [Clostridia bacterium]
MKLEGEAAQTPPWGGYTVTTRALDLMDVYNELINQGARNAGENKLYLKIGHYGSNATSDKGNTANSKGDGMISKGEKATFSCDYVWSTEYMPADKAFGFTQGALELTNDFNINYEAVAASCYSNVSLYAGYASKTQQAITPTVNGSTLSFAFDNIPAQCLADDILTTLAADYAANDSTRSAVANLTYSVRDYCEYMLNASSGDATFATLLSDVLAYGAAAQQYANYKTDDLATSVDATLTPSTFDASLVKGVRGVSGTASNIVDWKSATLKLDTTMTIQMTFAATDISDLTVGVQVGDRSEDTIASFVSLGNNQYRISYEVMASEFADTLTAKFYVGGEQTGRVLSYSVNGYVNNKLTSATGAYKTLLEAIANYGISVDNYIGEHPELMGEGRNEENVLSSAKTNYVSTAEFKRAIALNNDDTNLTLLKNVMNKAKAGEAITVATIGGSVTYGTGASETGKGSALRDTASYSALFRDWWKTTFPKSNVTHVNAGIGSTTSHLGVHRLQDHVLDYNPDVCIVEFSVNDFTNDWYGESYESLVAKLLDNDVAVILLFMVKESGSSTQAVNAATGAKYHLPMISYGDAIMPTIESGEHVWKDFSEDTVHPNLYGHAYAGELLWKYLNTVYAYTPNEVTVVNDKTGLEDTPYYNAALYGPLDIAATGSGAFTIDTSVTVGGLSGAWVVDSASTAETKEITFKAKFSQLGAFYDRNKTTDTAKGLADCEVYIDGVKVVTLYGSNSNEHMSTHIHTSDGVTEHTVTFRIVNSDTTEGFTLYRLLITE